METEKEKYILECEYCDPERPYSQKELTDMMLNLKKKLKLSNEKLLYTNNNYIYYERNMVKKKK